MRLRVVYRRVHCPFGRNKFDDSYIKKRVDAGLRKPGDSLDPRFRTSGPTASAVTCEGPEHSAEEVFGSFTFLHHCYLDSSTPEHPCFGCKQAKTWRKTIGLRTYRIAPELTSVNILGQPHADHPMQVVYLPLNHEGTEWYAMNAFTGERKEVVRHVDGARLTPVGHDLEQEVSCFDPEAFKAHNGGMFNVPTIGPVWDGVEAKDKWKCPCATCTGQEKRMIEDKFTEEEREAAVRALNVNAGGVRKSAYDYPSAPTLGVPTPKPAAPKSAMAQMFEERKSNPKSLGLHHVVGKRTGRMSSRPGEPPAQLIPRNAVFDMDDVFMDAELPVAPRSRSKKHSDGDDFITPAQALSEGFRMVSSTKKVTMSRSGGYDPKLGTKHSSNRDPTLEMRTFTPTASKKKQPTKTEGRRKK